MDRFIAENAYAEFQHSKRRLVCGRSPMWQLQFTDSASNDSKAKRFNLV